MFENVIIKQGKKVKGYRLKLRATQKDIAVEGCTKSNISKIENGKQKLTYELACVIAANFNRIAKEKGIEIEEITAEKLFEDEHTQSNRVFEYNQKELQEIKKVELFEQKLKYMEELIKRYEILDKNKIKLYKLASSFYLVKCMYGKSEEMCEKGLKSSRNSEDRLEEAHIYVNKALINMNLKYYEEALRELDYSEKLNKKLNNNQLSQRIFFNKALIYKKKRKYDKAIEYLKILKNEFEIKNENRLLDLKIMYANCLNEESLFNQAKNEYIEILELAMKQNNKGVIARTYRNLSELYFNEGKYKIAAEYITESLKNNPGDIYLNHFNEHLYYAAMVFKKLNKDSEKYLLKAFSICEKKDRENILLIEKILYELLLIYMNREDEDNIDIISKKTEELNTDYTLIFPILTEYYRDRNKEKSVYFNIKLINKIKKNKKI